MEKTETFKKIMNAYANKEYFVSLINDVNNGVVENEVARYINDRKKELGRNVKISDFNELEYTKNII